MITAEYNEKKLRVQGHALYAPYGKDIVCAGISAVVQGGAVALTDNEASFKFEKADCITITLAPEPSYHDYIVLRTIITQIKAVAMSYGEFVKVEEKHEF